MPCLLRALQSERGKLTQRTLHTRSTCSTFALWKHYRITWAAAQWRG